MTIRALAIPSSSVLVLNDFRTTALTSEFVVDKVRTSEPPRTKSEQLKILLATVTVGNFMGIILVLVDGIGKTCKV